MGEPAVMMTEENARVTRTQCSARQSPFDECAESYERSEEVLKMHIRYDAETGQITAIGRPGSQDFILHEFDISTEQLAGATVEREHRPSKIRLADNTIVTETWPPPRDLYDDV
jgi:hypothetical protein